MLIEEHVRVSREPEVRLFTARSTGPVDRTLLIVHGGPDWDHTYLLEPLLDLAGTHRLVFADLRGCGRSTTGLPAGAYTPEAVTADLLALLDALEVERCDVLGFSFGGLLAQRLVLAAPERVTGLIVASSSVLPSSGGARNDAVRTSMRSAGAPTPDQTRADAFASAAGNVAKPESVAELRRRLGRVRFTAEWAGPFLAGTLPPARPDDALARLAALDLPVLLLHGRQDTIFPADAARRAADALPRGRAVVFDDAGHMAHIDQPEQWLGAIVTFLRAGSQVRR